MRIFPYPRQLRHIGLKDASDIQIFEYAKTHDYAYAVATFDSDFVDLNVVKGFPPKDHMVEDRKPENQSHIRID